MAQNEDPGIGIPPLLSSALLKPTWALALTFHKKLFYERNKGHRYSTERSKGPEHGAPGGRSRLFSASPPQKKRTVPVPCHFRLPASHRPHCRVTAVSRLLSRAPTGRSCEGVNGSTARLIRFPERNPAAASLRRLLFWILLWSKAFRRWIWLKIFSVVSFTSP